MNKIKSYQIKVSGLVQGVGFRPFVYRIASKHALVGCVENRNDGVIIIVEGNEKQIDAFSHDLLIAAPTASSIISIEKNEISNIGFTRFEIIRSNNAGNEITEISPDIAVCEECLLDLDLQPHRFNYPFINCTNCGPRFTIINNLPYDRNKTTMNIFPMCSLCQEEYSDVLNRRFHAQPVACNHCGPRYKLTLLNKNNNESISDFNEILKKTAQIINSGDIVSIK
ncbi:MAG: acylphosphatase [Bacteroidota bacterium]